jgi:hypothetical protein
MSLVFACGSEGQDSSIISQEFARFVGVGCLLASPNWLTHPPQLARIHPATPLRESAGLLLFQLNFDLSPLFL